MTEALWTAETAADATGGRAVGTWQATGVSIDSRTIRPGDLFVALEGPTFDGHAFAADALAKGAAAVMLAKRPEAVPADAPALLVDDTQAGLEALGAAGRARSRARVIAVTGSVGKTGTKEALRQVLEPQGRTHASAASFNNHWGVPLSLARLPRDCAYAVFELGMNHPGEIRDLSRQVRPDVALVTTIAPAHLGFFDSLDGIADAKAEIFEGVAADGTAVVNRDNPYAGRLEVRARELGVACVLGFGAAEGAEVHLLNADCGAEGSRVRAAVDGREIAFEVALPGRHWVANALAVLACVQAAGADVDRAAAALAGLTPAAGRGTRRDIQLADGVLTLIDDSYNANPTSMRAAFDVLGRTPVAAGGRRIAALGDMLELGASSRELHAGLAEPLAAAGVDLAFTCGTEMAALAGALPAAQRGGHAEDSESLGERVAATVRAGDAVLVKGSAGARMGRVVAALDALDTRDGGEEGSHAS